MKAARALKPIRAAIPFLLVAAVVLSLVFFPKGEEAKNEDVRVVTVWHVETFEGGKGSRASFLKSAARRAEKAREGVYFLIRTYTAEGAIAAFSEGKKPDAISFGLGLGLNAEELVSLPYAFAGGCSAGKNLAYPWCRSGYYLFSLTDDFTEKGPCAISSGGKNLSVLAAMLEGIEGEEQESGAAYVGFLSGKYRYLLGTQRDICRFQTRGVEVFRRDLNRYNDLFQYFSVLNAAKREDCFALLNELLSAETQESLSQIGMLPVAGAQGLTLDVFSSEKTLSELAAIARAGDEQKNPVKFLKTI